MGEDSMLFTSLTGILTSIEFFI